MAKFTTTLHASGGKTTGIVVPDEIVAALGGGKKPPVHVTIGRYAYRSTIASMGGRFMIPVSAEHRAAAGISAGDAIEVEVSLDTGSRDVAVPADLAAALAQEPDASAFFASLSNSNRQRIALSIEGARTPETRQRRLEAAMTALRAHER